MIAANRLAATTKHGMKNTPEYRIWKAMRSRCGCTKSERAKDYSLRGISVCKRWDDFLTFYADMGPRPSRDHSIERIDNDGDYEPRNCRWATRIEQGNNKRNNVRISANGKNQTVAQWSVELGLNASTIRRRLRIGWSPDRALFEALHS
jgi:hypothetical protein